MSIIDISCTAVLTIIVVILIIVRKHLAEFLKDKSELPLPDRPYSLSRTLLFFWTIIIFLSICYLGITCDKLPGITTTVLTLLGIAISTATAGKAIDNNKAAMAGIIKKDDLPKTENFILDILSDENGISISRFQTVIFNLIYAGVFLAKVIDMNKFIDFDPAELALIGVSSGGYALMKITEQQTPKK